MTSLREVRLILPLAAFVLLAVLATPAMASKDETTLISRQSTADGGAGGDDASSNASVSADGRYVAFESDADNLSNADDNAVSDIFVRDNVTGTTALVSRQSTADGGAGGNGASSNPTISADGRFVAFGSIATNLSNADADAPRDIFVRDTQTGSTILVSRQSAGDGGAGGDAVSLGVPAISADGRFVAFASDADNLSAADNDTVSDIFVRDTQTDTTILASRQAASAGGAGGDGASVTPTIDADGTRIAFTTDADNLSTDDDDAIKDVYVRDRTADTTTLVSRKSAADGGQTGDGISSRPSISGDGRFISFDSEADNLSISDNDLVGNVYLRDTQAATTILVTRQSAADGGAGGDASSLQSSISSSGRFVSFSSAADNLSSSDSDDFNDVFLRDTQTATTILVSRLSLSEGGAAANNGSLGASTSGDGRFVTFQSIATNLSGADGAANDVFRRDVLGDTLPPETTIDSGPAAGSTTAVSTPTFTFSADEAPVTFQCSLDGAAFAPCTSPLTTASLADGSHTLAVRATDAEANTDPTPASRQFTVDTTPPDTTPPSVEITKSPKAKLKTKRSKVNASVSFSSEPGAEFECSVDGGAGASCASPFVAQVKTKPGKGKSHRIAIVATDAAGNRSAAAEVSFRAIRKR